MDKIKSYFSEVNGPLLLIIFGVLLMVIYVVYVVRAFLRARKDAAYIAMQEIKRRNKAERRNKVLRSIYNTSIKVPFLKKFLKHIEFSYLGICPYDAAKLVRIASETVALTFIVSMLAVLLVLSGNLFLEKTISWYSLACCVLVCYVAGVECSNYLLKKTERRIMEDMIRYFSAVKNAFVATRDVPLSISQAAEGLGHEINRQALVLHDILSGTQRETKVREYALAPTTNKYIKLFIQQAYEVSERGDLMGTDGESLFIKNLEFLRVEMKRDMHMKAKRLFRLEGYTFVCLFPIFCVSPLKLWGIKLAEEMKSFYDGAGEFLVMFSLLVTCLIYNAINKAKEVTVFRSSGKSNFFDRSLPHSRIRFLMERIEVGRGKWATKVRKMLRDIESRQSFGSFVLTMCTYALVVVVIGTSFFCVIHVKNKELLLTEVSNMDNIVSIATATAKENIKGHILDMTNEYLNAEDISEETLTLDFKRRMYMPNKEIVNKVVLEVRDRILSCRNEYLKWYEFYICCVAGLLAAYIPYIGLKYRYNLVLQGKSDEVRQFQCIILMERLFPSITSVQILEEMENFARVFKPSLQKCINTYSAGPETALRELRDAEKGNEEFIELVDGFIAVEKVGIAAAFAEVAGNREMAQVIRELDEERNLLKQKDITDTLSMIPAVLVVGVYFIGPFTLNVFSRLMVMFEMLEGFA